MCTGGSWARILHFYRGTCGINYRYAIPGYGMDTDLGIFELCDIGTLFDPLSFSFRGTLENYRGFKRKADHVHIINFRVTTRMQSKSNRCI